MSTTNKKRSSVEMEPQDNHEDLLARLAKENEQLKHQVKELEAKLAAFEGQEESDDDSDDESICDGSTWSVKYHQLKQYKQENGDCMVPYKHPQLGHWVNNTRAAFKKKNIPRERLDKLIKIGFYWGKGYPFPPSWDDRFRELQRHFTMFGHCNVHIDSNLALQTDLAKWVLEQRKQGKRLRKHKPSTLTLEQYNRLDGIKFIWKTLAGDKSTHAR